MWNRAAEHRLKKWERKKRLSDRARNPQLLAGAHLKHTHPAGLLFQSNLLVDAGRTSRKFVFNKLDLTRWNDVHLKDRFLNWLCRCFCPRREAYPKIRIESVWTAKFYFNNVDLSGLQRVVWLHPGLIERLKKNKKTERDFLFFPRLPKTVH